MALRGRFDRASERGAVLVEAAIIMPLVLIITFGMIEFSSAFQSSSAATAAARAGARVASAEAKNSSYAVDAAKAASSALRVIPDNEPVEMWVYQDNGNGYPSSGNFTTCSTNCIKYTWSTSLRAFDTTTAGGGGWPAASQNACQQAGWDSVGVYVKVNHKFLTKLFGASITLADHAIFRLEPAPTNQC
jgi:Flp pilus assembly protein TadG